MTNEDIMFIWVDEALLCGVESINSPAAKKARQDWRNNDAVSLAESLIAAGANPELVHSRWVEYE